MSLSRRTCISLLLCAGLLLSSCGGDGEQAATSTTTAQAQKLTTRRVVLFYEGPQEKLVAEARELPLPETDALAIEPLLGALLQGPANAAVPRLLPEGVIVRAAYLLPEGTAVVDLGGAPLVEGWQTGSHGEMMAVYGMVHTLTSNLSQVKRVRFLLNGQPAETLAGHISIEHSLRPEPKMVMTPQVQAAR